MFGSKRQRAIPNRLGVTSTNSSEASVATRPLRVDGPIFKSGGPSSSVQPQSINVILFGEAGVGKSAVANLIARRQVARTSSDVVGCMMQSTRHDITLDGTHYCIFDTVGLNQPSFVPNAHLDAIEMAYKLIVALKEVGGVHLLLFCIRGGRMTMIARNNYRLFAEFLCQTKVPVGIVATGLEREARMEDWWTRNKAGLEGFGIKSSGHACITTIRDDPDIPGGDTKYRESEQKIRELLKSCSLESGVVLSDATTWLATMDTGMRSLISGSKAKRKDIEGVLSKRLRLRPGDVKKIIDMMEKGT